jgi:EF-P beta-lysylation protein EpmB
MPPRQVEEGDTLAASPASASALPMPPARWQSELADAIRDPAELLRLLRLPDALLPAAERLARRFPLLVPRGFAQLMAPGDVADPLLRQVLPLAEEEAEVAGFSADPLIESGCGAVPGLLHKYHGRALLVTTGACAVHCRYCFRRHFPYDGLPRGRRWWQPALDHVAGDASLSEVLLSGGDPLTLPDAQLAALAGDLAGIPHLTRLRVHSRLPVVLPSRVDDGLIAWLTGTRLVPVVVIHANHPRELSGAVVAACGRRRAAGITVLNQSVLLAGINDRVETLAALSEGLFAAGVLPYYLHLLDRVQGSAHFLVADLRAQDLHRELATRLPGYLVPRLVREEPGRPGKTPVHA